MINQQVQQVTNKRMDFRKLLEPLLQEQQYRYCKETQDKIEKHIGELKSNGMNLLNFTELKKKFIRKFVTPGVFRGAGEIVEVDEASIGRVVQSAIWQAKSDFEEYANKMEQKICEKLPEFVIVSLSLEGNLWNQSYLTVTTKSGEIVQFATKTKINQTWRGHRFLQFPTTIQRIKQKEVRGQV